MNTGPAQGTKIQNFTDVLIYANGQTLGIYPLGSKIPIPSGGNTGLIIKGIIKVSGVGSLRADYELMHGCDTTISLAAGEVKKVTPVFSYYTGDQFLWLEDFEQSVYELGGTVVNGFDVSHNPPLYQDTTEKYDNGKFSLGVTSASAAEIRSQNAFFIPTSGTSVYLEFSYKSTVDLQMGIEGIPPGGTPTGNWTSPGGIYASPEWKKTYVSFTEVIKSIKAQIGQSNYNYFYIYFFTPTGGQIFIDDIKLVSAS